MRKSYTSFRLSASFLWLVISCLSLTAAAQNPVVRSAQAPESAQADYTVGALDLLEIRVFDLAQLDATVRVSESGTISLPLIGEFRVAGMTRMVLEEQLETALSEYVNSPQVSVFIREYESQRVSVIGAVANPGNYELVGRTSLLEAISAAGGIDHAEASGQVRVLRQGAESGETLHVTVDALLNQGDPASNLDLRGGDTINVVPKPRYNIYVRGQVRNPGLYEIRDRITLTRAISLAGGLADGAAAGGIRILRMRPDGSQETFKVDLNDIMDGKREDEWIEPDDVIFVPESFW